MPFKALYLAHRVRADTASATPAGRAVSPAGDVTNTDTGFVPLRGRLVRRSLAGTGTLWLVWPVDLRLRTGSLSLDPRKMSGLQGLSLGTPPLILTVAHSFMP